MSDSNWDQLVAEVDPLLGSIYEDRDGKRYRLVGLMHGKDDLTFELSQLRTNRRLSVSCVATLETSGFKRLVDRAIEEKAGDWFEFNGMPYETREMVLQCGFLNFCGCGRPHTSLAYIMKGLELIGEKNPHERSTSEARELAEAWYNAHRERLKAHFLTEGAEYFFYYWASEEGLTEHGGSVPGWLTDYGKETLEQLRKWYEEDFEDDTIEPDEA